jgi:geranylgeranyl pyrophosphate synthase
VDFAAYHARSKARIDTELAARLGEWFGGLAEEQLDALRMVLAQGKRLRGCLACLVAEALGGEPQRALPAALAVEIVQAASLVHDDFVDGDRQRRGRAAAWTVLTPRRAVLLADMMFATALERMARAGAPQAAALSHAIAAMARGALEESGAPDVRPRILQLKTGSLFAAAARLGALAAAAPRPLVEAAHEFGSLAGEAYQVADDVADAAVSHARAANQMNVLLDRAKAALAAFPDSPYTRLLAEAPGHMVGMMRAQAASAAR